VDSAVVLSTEMIRVVREGSENLREDLQEFVVLKSSIQHEHNIFLTVRGCVTRYKKKIFKKGFLSVLRIRIQIHRIHTLSGLLVTDPDPLVRGMDPGPAPDPDPSITKQKW
jgi:hypothetical protein